jgi:hypothetical protein
MQLLSYSFKCITKIGIHTILVRRFCDCYSEDVSLEEKAEMRL